ncbi:5-methylcytosine-specific restriction endonuclease McrA [Blastococcus aggregatus]|uniref:5-methylcytosine-specific restriction endonuclease McrA n=1 Tax=Blastococcus aggregatus TaxID=38502 RepID=A0A285V901_9ACTN|nr:HNH endonuclease signature motif containing protein [Blastococcus aggregatus]SOC50549.1 5-methylcytosine-specific restriction endonuclease McrA [Blastococcus aggregatus]
MFDLGGGYGVAVSVAPLELSSWPEQPLPEGVTARPSRLGDVLPVAARSDAEIAAELQRVVAVESALAAYKAELVIGLAARRPDTADRQLGEPGASADGWLPGPGQEPVTRVSEFFADELAVVLNCSRTAASLLADTAWVLLERLPATWAALADGELDWSRARGLAAELSDAAHELEPAVMARIEAAVLPGAAALSIRTLRERARAELERLDDTAADRRRKRAQRASDVTVTPARDGMAELRVFLPRPLAAAIQDAVDRYARLAKADGDTSPIGLLRVGVLGDLVLRPWDESRPPVTAHLTVHADLATLRNSCGDAEVDGQPITAAHLRELLEQLDALCPGGLQAPAGGTLHLALTDPVSGALRAVLTRGELERLVRRGCPQHPDGRCGCPIVDSPGTVDRYRPTPAQRRYLSARDRTCRHPGCRNSVAWADLDHVVPHADGGATSCANLCCLCRRHHRLKTHAPGWRFTMTADGVLTVTTPSGIARTTRPPGSRIPDRSDDDPPPF